MYRIHRKVTIKASSKFNLVFKFSAVFMLVVPGLSQSKVSTTFDIESGLVFSDNIGRSSDAKSTQTVARLQPAVTFILNSNRSHFKGNIAAEMLYFSESEETRIDPQLYLTSDTRVIDKHVFFESRIQYRQVDLDPDRISTDNVVASDGTADSVQLQLSPYFRHNLNGLADFNARYTYSRLAISSSSIADSVGNGLNLTLVKSPDRNPFHWALGSTYRTLDQGKEDGFTDSNVVIETGYFINQDFLVLLLVGKEWVQIESEELVLDSGDGTQTLTDGSTSTSDTIWETGVIWKPNRRTTLEARYGERGFGRKPTIKAEIKGRRSLVALTWTKDYTSSRQQLSNLDALPVESTDDALTQSGLLIDVPLGVFESIAVDETVRLTYGISGRRTDFLFEVLNSRRESSGSDASEKTTQFRSLLTRQINRHINASIEYIYTNGTNDERESKFEENTVAFNVKYSF